MIHAAELIFYRAADDVDDHARRGEKMPMEMRGRIRMDIAMVPRLCRDAVNNLYTIGGAAGLSLKSPIQLAARNIQAANMHGFLLYDAGAEIYGRVLLGVDPEPVSFEWPAMSAKTLVPAADYIQAIALHVSSVCVITTALGGERFGLTATAVSSVSAEPPRLLVCINKSGVSHDKILAAGRFCVNVLAEEQDKIAHGLCRHGRKRGRPVRDRRMDHIEDRIASAGGCCGRIRLHGRRNMRSIDPSRCLRRCGGDGRTQGKGHASLRRTPLPSVAQGVCSFRGCKP